MKFNATVLLIVTAATICAGQHPPEDNLCDKVSPPILALFQTAKVTRRDGSPTECRLSFSAAPATDLVVNVLAHNSVKESRDEFRSHYRFIIPSFERRRWSVKISSRAVGSAREGMRRDWAEHAMFLRSGRYTITLLASSYEDLEKTEAVLRNVRFFK